MELGIQDKTDRRRVREGGGAVYNFVIALARDKLLCLDWAVFVL
jgi:hypothetical protein